MSSKFEIFPYINVNGEWTIPDNVMAGVWGQIVKEDKAKHLFYDGTIKSEFDFIEFLRRPGTFPVLVVDDKKQVVHIAWLKDCFEIGAWAHHCSVGPYQRGAWETVRDYWKKYFTNLKLLLGMTPKTNDKAVKFLKKICKFTVVGEVPHLCNMAYDGERVPGIFSYYEL